MKKSVGLLIIIALALTVKAQNTLPDVVSGHIERIENFESAFVTSRNVDVWLPEGYDETKKYAVLYMHDGQMLYDPEKSWNKQAWNIDEAATALSRTHDIQKFIVVGIWNGGATRHADYFPQKPFESLTKTSHDTVNAQLKRSHVPVKKAFSPQSDNYLKFMVTELKPFIDSTYSVYPDKENTFVMGSSMGGLISMYAICEYPQVFGGAACLSTHWPGTFTLDNNPIPAAFIQYLDNHLPDPQQHKIYFDCGDQTLDALYPTIQKQVDALMVEKGYDKNSWLSKYFPGENHSENAWSKRLHVPVEFLFTKNGFRHHRLINGKNFAFPGGKLKCLVMSFDDGPEHDRILLEKLNKANIVGTFHLNSGRLGKKADWLSTELGYDVHFVTESEVGTLYQGHEISGHTAHHTGLNNQHDSIINFEVASDIQTLNKLIRHTNHYKVQGLAYPFGAYDNRTLDVLKKLGVKYARTTASTQNFELPHANFLALDPTCHIFDAPDFASYFIYSNPEEMQLLNIWGHSYEFHNNWKLADSICNILGNKKDIWYAQTIEMIDYLTAIKELTYFNDSVYNPSKSTSVWVKNNAGDFIELRPQQTIPVAFQSSYIDVKTLDHLYPDNSTRIKYHGNWTKVHYQQRITQFKKSPLHYNDIVFIGNSITEQGRDWGEKLRMKNVRNRGIAGDVTDGVIKRIHEITYYKPKTVFLLIGINDLFNLHYNKEIPSVEYVANNILEITALIHKESPKTKIYLQTILPTSEKYMVENINRVNAIIREQEKNADYELIDLFEVFVGADGLIKPELTSDGTHLNESGYKLWVKTLQSTMK